MVFLLRKIGFYVFIAASIAIAIWGYFRLKESKAPDALVLEHIPTEVSCLIETKNCSELVSQLTRQNLIWNALLSNTSMQVAQNGIRFLDSLVHSSPEITDVVSGNSVYWAFIKKEKMTEHLILFKVKEKNNEGVFVDFFTKVFTKDPSVSSFEAFSFVNNKQKWLVCYKDGIVYVSSDLGLLQNCLELNKEGSLAKNKTYLDLIKENGEQNTQIYFNHASAHLFSKQLFSQQSLFDVDVQLNEITLTGCSNVDSSSILNGIKHQDAESIRGYEELPDNPDMIEGITLNDVGLFYKNVSQQQIKEQRELNEQAWEMLNDSALYNIKNESYENIDKEIVAATYVLDNVTSRLLSLKIKDVEKSELLLKLMS
ncbi:MAG: hypothetical protein HY062_01520, partial [Bacteroidetes bacterium]|nr:hypothetical protein [Bacteroidota bacterium]